MAPHQLNSKKEVRLSSRMELSTRANGWVIRSMAMECKCGQMVLAMRATGRIIRHVERENSGMLMGMYSRVNGRMIRLMDMEFMCI